MEKLTRKRPQPGPQPPPTYTSHGTVPDGYITWNASRPELRLWLEREYVDSYVYIKTRHGTIRLGGKVTDTHRLN
jgi:hypothetical protein